MPVIPVEQFRANYLNANGLAGINFTNRRNRANGFQRNTQHCQKISCLIFCADDCDSILALRILKMHGIYNNVSGINFDVIYVSSLDDIYNIIEEQQKDTQENPLIQLKPYLRIILLGFGSHIFISMDFFAALQNHFLDSLDTQEERNELQFWVFDYRRPFLKLFENETENWFLVVDNSEYQSWLESKGIIEGRAKTNKIFTQHSKQKKSKIKYSSSSPSSGIYFSFPICHLMNQIVSDLGANKAIYAKKEFLTSISLFWHYLQQYIETDDYEELLSLLKKEMRQGQIYIEDEFALSTRYGTLPFLQYSSLEDALYASDHIFVQSHDETDESRDNEIRMNCGVTKKEMQSHQSEFRITNKEPEIHQHLHEKYGNSVNTMDWARLEHPDLNNAVLAHMSNFILSFNSEKKSSCNSSSGNCRDFQHIIETLVKIDYSYDSKTEAQLLQAILPASQLHLTELFTKIKHGKMEARKCGGDIVWHFNFRGAKYTHLHPMQLRLIALLSSSYKARGDKTRCSSIILSVTHPSNQEKMSIYAVNPVADKENPDLWPSIIYYLDLQNALKQNSLHPCMATMYSNKFNDIKSQMLELYKKRHQLGQIFQESSDLLEKSRISVPSDELATDESDNSPLNKKIKLSSTTIRSPIIQELQSSVMPNKENGCEEDPPQYYSDSYDSFSEIYIDDLDQ